MPVVWFIALVMTIVLFLATYRIYREEKDVFSHILSGVSAAIGGWILCELIIQLVSNSGLIIFIHEFKFLFILGIPGMVHLLAYQLRYKKKEPKVYRLLKTGAMVILLLVIITNSSHHLFRIDMYLDKGFMNVVQVENGVLYYVLMVYNYGLLLLSFYHILRYHLTLPKIYQGKTMFMLAGIVLSFGSNIIYQYLQIFMDVEFDITPLSFGVISWMLYYALYIYDNKNISNVIQSSILNEWDSGVIFEGKDNRIHYVNEMILNISNKKMSDVFHKTIDVFSGNIFETIKSAEEANEPVIFRYTTDRVYVYEISIKELIDESQQYIGRIILFKDITAVEIAYLNKKYQLDN